MVFKTLLKSAKTLEKSQSCVSFQSSGQGDGVLHGQGKEFVYCQFEKQVALLHDVSYVL